ncbi:T-cell surface glycoprotein CD8 alpha chain isoform X2 [Siniperca chuatsi]|nr:T-cell surface glycoprotein CD8 alpha chain isoform X2 [Siniperca chuatsi]
MTPGAGVNVTAKEGAQVEISCQPRETGSMVVWFRVLDQSGMEFIASFSNNGIRKSPTTSLSLIFSEAKIGQHILTLQSFDKARDSGVYGCASLYKGIELKFGQVTRLDGEKVATGAPLPITTQTPCTTTTPCVCNNNNNKGETSFSMFCTPIILVPLAGGCGLLLLLLIITSLYCNHIRTRRCPHHYKRKPRTTASGTQMKTNRHI